MSGPSAPRDPSGRARVALAVLTALAVLLSGVLSTLAGAEAGPLTGLGFALVAAALTVVLALLARVTTALERFRRAGRGAAQRESKLRLFGGPARWIDRHLGAPVVPPGEPTLSRHGSA